MNTNFSFVRTFKNLFQKKEQPKAATTVTPSLSPVDKLKKIKKIFMPQHGTASTPYFDTMKYAAIRKKRRVRNRMQKHSRRVNYGLA